MKEGSLICKSKGKFKTTTDSKHNKPVAPNFLEQNFTTTSINQCWVADITYIPNTESWLYLATVIDLYSRKIVGWSMSNNMKDELVKNAILMSIFIRKPARELIWNTNRKNQYVAEGHLKVIKQHGII